MRKGHLIRLFLDDAPVAAATSCTLHVSAQVEDASTKDTEDGWVDNVVTGLSWDAQSDALVLTDEDGANNLTWMFGAVGNEQETYAFELSETSGAKNRDVDTVLCSGSVRVTEVTVTAANRQNTTVSCRMQGEGTLGVTSGGGGE